MARVCAWCAFDPWLACADKDSGAIRRDRPACPARRALPPCGARWSPHCLLWHSTCPGALPRYSPCGMCTLVARGGNLGSVAAPPPAATLQPGVTYALCGMCPVCAALCRVLPTRPGLICSGASTPCSMCPEICVCSSFALSTTGGGASSYPVFLFTALSSTYPPFLHNAMLALLLPQSTSPDPHHVNVCYLLPLSRHLRTMSCHVMFPPC